MVPIRRSLRSLVTRVYAAAAVEPFDDLDTEPVPHALQGAERRRSTRRYLSIPTRIDTRKQQHRFGMTQNLSRTGALFATPSRFRIGERATLRFCVGEGEESEPIEARIVRLELNEADAMGVLQYFMAVIFTQPLEGSVPI